MICEVAAYFKNRVADSTHFQRNGRDAPMSALAAAVSTALWEKTVRPDGRHARRLCTSATVYAATIVATLFAIIMPRGRPAPCRGYPAATPSLTAVWAGLTRPSRSATLMPGGTDG